MLSNLMGSQPLASEQWQEFCDGDRGGNLKNSFFS